jgi:hypothetical protein
VCPKYDINIFSNKKEKKNIYNKIASLSQKHFAYLGLSLANTQSQRNKNKNKKKHLVKRLVWRNDSYRLYTSEQRRKIFDLSAILLLQSRVNKV